MSAIFICLLKGHIYEPTSWTIVLKDRRRMCCRCKRMIKQKDSPDA
jgi:hypothetical protein